MIKRIGLQIFGILFWCAATIVFGQLLGADGAIVGALGVLTAWLSLSLLKAQRRKKLLTKIENAGEQPIRFDGALVHEPLALKIGQSNGWVAKRLPQTSPDKSSILFTPGEGASSAQDLLAELTEAGLVRKVQIRP